MNTNKYNVINGHIQVYSVWVHGRCIDDEDQQFPIDSNITSDFEWHNDFQIASNDYLQCKVSNEGTYGFHDEIYKDYYVCLFSIDINIEEFENMFDLDFDLNNENVIEMIPYYINYNFNTVAERIANF